MSTEGVDEVLEVGRTGDETAGNKRRAAVREVVQKNRENMELGQKGVYGRRRGGE